MSSFKELFTHRTSLYTSLVNIDALGALSTRIQVMFVFLGTNEQAIIDVTATRCNAQRQKIRLEFKTAYGNVCNYYCHFVDFVIRCLLDFVDPFAVFTFSSIEKQQCSILNEYSSF